MSSVLARVPMLSCRLPLFGCFDLCKRPTKRKTGKTQHGKLEQLDCAFKVTARRGESNGFHSRAHFGRVLFDDDDAELLRKRGVGDVVLSGQLRSTNHTDTNHTERRVRGER